MACAIEFHHETIFDEEVKPARSDGTPLVIQCERQLPLKHDVLYLKLNSQGFFVNALQIPWTKPTMNLDGRSDNALRHALHRFPEWRFLCVLRAFVVHFFLKRPKRPLRGACSLAVAIVGIARRMRTGTS